MSVCDGEVLINQNALQEADRMAYFCSGASLNKMEEFFLKTSGENVSNQSLVAPNDVNALDPRFPKPCPREDCLPSLGSARREWESAR